MKKHWISFAALVLALCFALAGCGSPASGSVSAEPKDYAQILRDARSDEFNEAFDIITSPENDTFGVLDAFSLDPEAMEQYAVSVSIRNTQAYGVMIVKPKDGQAETIKTAMQDFIQRQTDSFELYLEDQYEIAKDAKLETMPSGELVLVMSEDASAIMESIKNALK